MHYHAEIWVAEKEDFETQIEKILAPFEEKYTDEDFEGFWDWYQIGGRWTGIHTGYDPESDERNLEVCRLCNGTGYRTDDTGLKLRQAYRTYTCNGCGIINREKGVWEHGLMGRGRRIKWPADFVSYEGDVISVSEIKDSLECYALIIGDKIFQDAVWNGKDFVSTDFNGNVMETLRKLDVSSGYLVTVDYHS